MLQLQNKLFLLPLCAVIFISCGFIDLRPVGIDIEPGVYDSILPEKFSPVIIKFDTEVIKNEAEMILQISSDYGAARGDIFWRDNDLYFVPVQGWTAGIRYTLSMTGTIRSVDGRESRLDRFIAFFAINRNPPPVLEWHSPSGSASIGTGNNIFEFHFSRSMDKLSVESALTIDGAGNITHEWSADDHILNVIPEKSLLPWVAYRWNLRDSAKCIDGVPLPRSYSGHFTTDSDQTLPYVTEVFPVLFSDGSWYPTGAAIETGLGLGHGIAVSFNKPMGESALRSLRFEPSLSGRTEFLSDNSIVHIFSRDPEPEVFYTLIISGDTRDSEGLKLGSDFKKYFIPDIPYLNVLSFTANAGSVTEAFPITNRALPVYIDPQTGELFFSIRFSLPFGLEEKINTPQRISLVPFFPGMLAPVALQYVSWISDDRLFMRWEGLKASDTDNAVHFYKLTVPGGRSGVSSAKGIIMKEDLIIYLEAIN
ncbi:MAG: hypothetical protein FWD40_11290 [Treponema sp.]|nr:hypothetical protein [Treponema sp.]